MNRVMALVCVLAILLPGASPVAAYQFKRDNWKYPELFVPSLESDHEHTMWVDRDLPSQLTWDDHTPSIGQIIGMIDRSAQLWSRHARVNVAIMVDDNQNRDPDRAIHTTCGPAYAFYLSGSRIEDGHHAVIHGPQTNCEGRMRAYSACTKIGSGPAECDIVMLEHNGSFCSTNHEIRGDPSWWGGDRGCDFGRVIGHEMGHMLGLDDLYDDNPTGICNVGSERPSMCGSNQASWDGPSPDDIEGVRAFYSKQNRRVRMLKGEIGSSGGVTWGDEPFNPVPQIWSFSTPRVSCRPDVYWPDCVVGTTTDECNPGFNTCVRLWTTALNSPAGPWVYVDDVKIDNSTRHDVDVAMGPSTAVAVFLDSEPAHPARFVAWNRSSSTAEANDVFHGLDAVSWDEPASNQHVKAHQPPRVSYFEAGSRFVAAFVDHQRRIRISVSKDAQRRGTDWTWAYRVKPFPGQDQRRSIGPIDLICPTHQPGVSTCRIFMNDYFENLLEQYSQQGYPSEPVWQRNMNFYATICEFTPPDPYPNQPTEETEIELRCYPADKAATVIGSISDYGAEVPPGAPQINAWLHSMSRRTPEAANNTEMVFNSGYLRIGQDRSYYTFNTPAYGGLGPSRWGGVSCDFVEYGHRFVCVELREPLSW